MLLLLLACRGDVTLTALLLCRTSGEALSAKLNVPGAVHKWAARLWLTRPRPVTDALLALLSQVCSNPSMQRPRTELDTAFTAVLTVTKQRYITSTGKAQWHILHAEHKLKCLMSACIDYQPQQQPKHTRRNAHDKVDGMPILSLCSSVRDPTTKSSQSWACT